MELDSQGHTPQQIQSPRRIYESRARAHRAESNLDRLLVLDALAGITTELVTGETDTWPHDLWQALFTGPRGTTTRIDQAEIRWELQTATFWR